MCSGRLVARSIVFAASVLLFPTTVCAAVAGDDSEARSVETCSESKPRRELDHFFALMRMKTGAETARALEGVLAIDEKDEHSLASQIENLLKVLGRPVECQEAGVRSHVSLQDYEEWAYVCRFEKAPVLWEARVYRADDCWRILFLEFSADDVIGRLKKYSSRRD